MFSVTRRETSRLLQLTALLLELTTAKLALCQESERLASIEPRVRKHIEATLTRRASKESEVRPLLETELPGWKDGKQYTIDGKTFPGPEEHPWIKANPDTGANPDSVETYKQDSKNAWDGETFTTESWSCFQPQLVAVGSCTKPPIAAEADLGLACQAYCCLDEWIPFVDVYPNTIEEEKFEVIQFWFPEHQSAINNYGRMRLDPTPYGNTGANYARKQLLQRKQNSPEKTILDELKGSYPLPAEKLKRPSREDPFRGQRQWGGSAGDSTDHLAAHVYRTHISAKLSDRAPKSPLGWALEKRTIYDSLAPPTNKKQILNLWTEYGVFDALTTVDSLSYSIADRRVQSIMGALFGGKAQASKRARENPAFYQSQGSAAYRLSRWPADFQPIGKIADIAPDASQLLREAVYRGPVELMPLTLSQQGFGVPEISFRAIAARRSFELAGLDAVAAYLPGGDSAVINKYTIDGKDRGREADKMQLLAPFLKKNRPSECFRSQKIPSMLDQTEDAWTKENLPSDTMGYVKKDNSDSAFAYWNKRVACTCKFDSMVGSGSKAMNWVPDAFGPGRGDGDRTYGKIESKLCEYPENKPPNAWLSRPGASDLPTCLETGTNGKQYKGIQDDV